MNVDAIQNTGLPHSVTPSAGKTSAIGPEFDAMVSAGLGKVNETLQSADASLQAFAAGADVPVHDVMINMEKARLSLQFAVEVRNHVVDAYQEFMRMQL